MELDSHACGSGQIKIISGNRLTIDKAAEFLRVVRDALSNAAEIELEFTPEAEIDITGMQILCSSCKSAASAGKVFRLKGEQPQSLVNLILSTGAGRGEFCKYNRDSPCIWFGGSR